MKPLRIWLVGFGTVGRWVVRALDSEGERLAGKYGIGVTVVGLASARDGFIYDGNGLDLRSVLGLASEGRSIAEHPGVRWWPSTIEGLRATEADLLVEVTASPSADGQPGVAHIREALRRRIPVVTSNKWPVALRGVELVELARSRGVAFRAESTVTDISRSEIDQAASGGTRLKHVAPLAFSDPDGAGSVTARVEPELVPGDDPLANIEGTSNAVVCRAEPLGEVTIIGPGAGPQLAGQGVFSDLIAFARSRTRD